MGAEWRPSCRGGQDKDRTRTPGLAHPILAPSIHYSACLDWRRAASSPSHESNCSSGSPPPARAWLVSPFLTRSVSERIRDAVEQSSARERRLPTALSNRSLQVGVLDARALLVLHEGDFRLSSIRNLHAKVSIVDGEWGWSAPETSLARAWEANKAAT